MSSIPIRSLPPQLARQTGKFVEHFARVGYAAKGVVYVIVGVLAAVAASGNGGRTTGSRGALQTLAEQPFGQILLGVVAIGLAGYAIWQFIRAIEDPENEGSDGKAIFKRIGFLFSGLVHFGLVWYAIGIITGAASGSDDDGAKSWSATAMSYALGRWLLGAGGIGLGIYGIWQLVRASQANLDKRLRLGEMNDKPRRFIVHLSRFGLAARGVVFGIMGVFLTLAAWRHDPSEAKGLGGALQTLQEQPYGPWLLGTVAIGLIAYGVYEFVQARYRQIRPT